MIWSKSALDDESGLVIVITTEPLFLRALYSAQTNHSEMIPLNKLKSFFPLRSLSKAKPLERL